MFGKGGSSRGVIALCIAPLAVLLGTLAVLSQSYPAYEKYLEYRKFWGGNTSEVYSHWLDMVLMAGNALALAWLLSLEAYLRTRPDLIRLLWVTSVSRILCVILTGVIALILDRSHGEGTVFIAYLIFFLPLLGTSYYLLRQFAAQAQWRFRAVLILSAAYGIVHTAAQLYYEPSETGAPNERIVPIWLLTVGAALVWALVRGIRTGWLGRFFINFGKAVRKPAVWGTATLLALAVGVPFTIHAHRLRKPHEKVVMPWLNELETKLSDAFVADLRRDYVKPGLGEHTQMPIFGKARALFDDSRIKSCKSLRIFVPVSESKYLFLCGNDTFAYCDLRSLQNQIDQGFIDRLLAQGGTQATRLYAVLWSPYMAGRVLNAASGKTKAICVINSQE